MNKTLILLVVALILNSRVEAQWVQTNGPYEGHVPTLATMGTNVFAGTLGGEVFLTTDGGASWTNPPGPIESQTLNSDSSISVDPGNRVYFTFDYPYAGTTAVCTSDDKGDSWRELEARVPRALALAV